MLKLFACKSLENIKDTTESLKAEEKEMDEVADNVVTNIYLGLIDTTRCDATVKGTQSNKNWVIVKRK